MAIGGDVYVNSTICIPESELAFHFARSSGPGGQHVNKSNTKAELRWNVVASGALTQPVRDRLRNRYTNRINDQGELVITSDVHRSQLQNRRECVERLRSLVGAVAVAPRKRKKTKPTRASRERRLRKKNEQSQKKQNRRFRPPLD